MSTNTQKVIWMNVDGTFSSTCVHVKQDANVHNHCGYVGYVAEINRGGETTYTFNVGKTSGDRIIMNVESTHIHKLDDAIRQMDTEIEKIIRDYETERNFDEMIARENHSK